MSMNFLRFVEASFLATLSAAWLSIVKGVGLCSVCWMSASMRRIHCVCCAAWDAARYSASHVDVATVGCRDDFQLIGAPYSVCMMPVRDFLSGSLAQSESL